MATIRLETDHVWLYPGRIEWPEGLMPRFDPGKYYWFGDGVPPESGIDDDVYIPSENPKSFFILIQITGKAQWVPR